MTTKSRSRRLRKKLHVGEFQEFGFSISFSLLENLESKALDDFVDEFLAEAIENNSLKFGGGFGGNDSGGFATLNKRGGTTEDHRALVRNWLAAHPHVTNMQIGELVDAWA